MKIDWELAILDRGAAIRLSLRQKKVRSKMDGKLP